MTGVNGVNEMTGVNGVNGRECWSNEGQECGERVETAVFLRVGEKM